MACCLHRTNSLPGKVLMHIASYHLRSNRVLRALKDERPRFYVGKISPVV